MASLQIGVHNSFIHDLSNRAIKFEKFKIIFDQNL